MGARGCFRAVLKLLDGLRSETETPGVLKIIPAGDLESWNMATRRSEGFDLRTQQALKYDDIV